MRSHAPVGFVIAMLCAFSAAALAQTTAVSALQSSGSITIAGPDTPFGRLSAQRRLASGDTIQLGSNAELLWRANGVFVGLQGPGRVEWSIEQESSRGSVGVEFGELTAQVAGILFTCVRQASAFGFSMMAPWPTSTC